MPVIDNSCGHWRSNVVNGTEHSKYVDKTKYQSLVGSLLYLFKRTRPDITYAVSVMERFCCNPITQHMTAVKRILRYLRGTTLYGLFYKRGESEEFIGYSDADWGGRGKKQTCVVLSMADAMYIALAGAAQEAVWVKKFNLELANTPDSQS
uniref:Reverse transcriptase Ty1/copia-type domain-containing protein n=1 Tax=Amphimedon queenslandica TaxID=400682 RepID=A0A1X7TDT0_AMPQE